MQAEVATPLGLIQLLQSIFYNLPEDGAVVLAIKHDCTFIGARRKGHGVKNIHKLSNFGFGNGDTERERWLVEAIKNIAEINASDLPLYCYQAIMGDKYALRLTTEHLQKVYQRKAERMEKKGKPKAKIAQIWSMVDQITRYLDLSDDDLSEVVDTILIEVPKNPKRFKEDITSIGGKYDEVVSEVPAPSRNDIVGDNDVVASADI